jgi:hypothetical protein
MIYPAAYNIRVLQNSTFKIRITVRDSASNPINLTGYVIDADVRGYLDDAFITTFTVTVIDAANGIFDLELLPLTTEAIEVGKYCWDLSLTSSGGERYYWLKGDLNVDPTCSRNE